MDKEVSYQPQRGVIDNASEIIWGKRPEKQKFEDSVQDLFAEKAEKHLNHRGKLGAKHY